MRKTRLLLLMCICTLFFFGSCSQLQSNRSSTDYSKLASNPDLIHNCGEQLTDVIVLDIFKPPVAARIYSYAYLAAYEALRNGYNNYPDMAGKLNQFTSVPAPEHDLQYCFPLAAVTAFNRIGKELTYSDDIWENYIKTTNSKFQAMGIPDDVYKRSIAYGESVAAHVLKYAKADRFDQTRGIKYAVVDVPGKWVPTPPTYADACEPVWSSIRHFLIDSAAQFKPAPCAPYDMHTDSKYYKLLKEVYDINKHLTQDQKAQALFWDDNAFVTHVSGHVSYATKKMTPPGHWLAILKTVAKKQDIDMMKSIQAYLITSVAMHDAFICSYDEKYKSVRVRPITVIQRSIDPNWMPLLETPSFPEYASAHSAISAAAGTVLTKLIGDSIPFTDSTEYKYGYGVRSFKSFKQAYNETNISRVYGGIHYRDGAFEAKKQGERIGEFILKKLNFTGSSVADNKQNKQIPKI